MFLFYALTFIYYTIVFSRYKNIWRLYRLLWWFLKKRSEKNSRYWWIQSSSVCLKIAPGQTPNLLGISFQVDFFLVNKVGNSKCLAQIKREKRWCKKAKPWRTSLSKSDRVTKSESWANKDTSFWGFDIAQAYRG